MDALTWFRTAVDDDPDEPRARFSLANELLKRNQDADAVEQLRAYLDLAEDEGNAWGKLAEALTRLGRIDEAANAYLAGIEQSLKHGHSGMADDFVAALEALPEK